MPTCRYHFGIEVPAGKSAAVRKLMEIGDDKYFTEAYFEAYVDKVEGQGSKFIEVDIGVGDEHEWMVWTYDYEIARKGGLLLARTHGPAHPRWKRAWLEVKKRDVNVNVALDVHVSLSWEKIAEKPSEPSEKPTEPKPPEERPPSQPEKPSEPFDVGGWIEYGLRKILRDEEPPSCFPSTTRFLVVLLAMIYTAALPQVDFWVRALGLVAVPAILVAEPWRLLTYIFVHYPMVAAVNGYVIPHAHIAMNTLFLWVFGDNVECRVGKGRYLGYFLVLGVLAGLGQVLWMHAVGLGFAEVYIVGASGAISGLMGMYLVFWPGNRVVLLGRRMSAWLFLVLWFLGQVGMLFSLGLGVAVAGHVTGFICGLVLGYAEKRGLEGLRWVSEVLRR